jgi:hypothetical protein
MYYFYGIQISEMQQLAKRLNVKLPLNREVEGLLQMHPQRAELVAKLFLDAKRVYAQVAVLDREIERRNALVGVMG